MIEAGEIVTIPKLTYRTGLCLLIVVITVFFCFKAECGKTSDLKSELQDGGLKILYSGTDRVELLLSTPQFSIEPVRQVYLGGEKEFSRLSVEGYGYLSEGGKPQLPMKGVLLAVPEGAEVAVKVSGLEVSLFSGLSVYPVSMDASIGLDGEALAEYKPNALNPLQKSIDSFYPGELAEIGFSGYLRDSRVVQLCIYPVQYNPRRKEVKLHRKLHLTVEFVYKFNSNSLAAPNRTIQTSAVSKPSKDWDKIYNHTIANYQSVLSFHPSNPPVPLTAPINQPSQPRVRYKLIVAEDGIYHLTYRELVDAKVDVSSINPKTLKLTNKGRAVPLFVSGENDGEFDRRDYLEFYGEFNRGEYSLYGEYSIENVYWLSWGQENGARMVPLGVTPKESYKARTPLSYRLGTHFEKDNLRGSLGYVDGKRDIWFWGDAMGQETLKYTFELQDVIKTSECRVCVMLHGQSILQHHTRILLNGVELSDALWNGQMKYLYESQPLQGTLLKNGENVLEFQSVGDTPAGRADIVYFNWFEIEYWRAFSAVDGILAFEIKEAGAYQFKLTGFSNKAIEVYKGKSCKLQNYKIFREGDTYSLTFFDEIATPTKYLAICTQRKKKPKPFITHSSKNELVPILLTKDEPSSLCSPSNGADYIIIVYDHFYDDVLPLAKHRSNQFRTLVVKVSDIYDEFSHGLLSPEAIRDFLRYAYFYWRKPSPSYVLLAGDANWDFKRGKNYVPSYYFKSFKLGQTATDNLYACINGDDPLPDLFIGRIPTSTKEETRAVVEKILRYEQEANLGIWRRKVLMLAGIPRTGDFERDSERLISDYISPEGGYEVMRVYTDPKSTHYGGTAELLDFWNQGTGFVHFTGHGGGAIWSDNKLLTLDGVGMLQNKHMPAFVASFTCFTGYFDAPNQNCISELFVKKKEGGAIAAFGSSGLGWVQGDYYMERAMFESLYHLGTRRLGKVMAETKIIMMINHRSYTDMVNLYNLLGDAAVMIPLPREKVDMTALLRRDKRLDVRGIVGKVGTSCAFHGSALLEVESPTDTLEFPNTRLKIEGGRFDITMSPAKSGQKLQAGEELLVRCYAWNDDKGKTEDAAGAFILKIAGQDDVDLSVFADDITFASRSDGRDENLRRVKLQATIYNLGQKQASSVLVYFYAGNPFSGGFRIGQVVIPQIEGASAANAEMEWQTDTGKGSIYVQVDPINTIKELNEANNTAEKMLVFSVFTITPENGSAGEINSLDGNIQVWIEKGAVLENVVLAIESDPPPILSRQPQLQYSPLFSKMSGRAYRLSVTKYDGGGLNDLLSPQAVIHLTFKYDETRSENEIPENLVIFKYKDDLKQWEIASLKEEQQLNISAHTVSAAIPLTPEFASGLFFTLISTTDQTPPLVQLSLSDERLSYDGFYTSETPTLAATISDANGVGKILFFLNEKQIGDVELAASYGMDNVTMVSLSPTLKAGNYHLRVNAFDLCGNSSEETLSFDVGGDMKLLKVSNHPNPFADETYFTYVLLDEADEVKIKIYTTSGRLIAQLDAPKRLGYNEILWKGRDKDDEDVANGVYFYKIIVKTEKEKLSHIGKLLVQR